MIIVSSARPLVYTLAKGGSTLVLLEKRFGETIIADTETPDWEWLTR